MVEDSHDAVSSSKPADLQKQLLVKQEDEAQNVKKLELKSNKNLQCITKQENKSLRYWPYGTKKITKDRPTKR